MHHFRDLGAVNGGAGIQGIGGETDLIVYDYVYRAARRIAPGGRHVEGFHNHALAGESRIAMNGNGHDLLALSIFAALLPRAHRAFNYRCDNFKMRRIEGERHVHIAAVRLYVGRKALVIFDVTGFKIFIANIVLTFKLAE